MALSEWGKETVSSMLQLWNVHPLISVIPSGISMDDKDAQSQKTEVPSSFSSEGKETVCNEEQWMNAEFPIETTEFGMSICHNSEQKPKATPPIWVTPIGKSIDSNWSQWLNANLPMLFTPSGMLTLLSDLLSAKALSEMIFSQHGTTMLSASRNFLHIM